ncbi:MAG: hypothetical protein HY291_06225 [Planctomycetes bacterium]|nr:hypothetical protein [Planctomycetota bacterium]
MVWKRMLSAGFCAAVALSGVHALAEDGQDAPKPEGKPDGKAEGKRQRMQRGGDNQGGDPAGGQGGGRGGRMGGPGGFGGFGGPGGGRGGLERMLLGAMGIEPGVKTDQLTYGSERRLVTRVPVGGIDSLNENADGFKVEEIYTLTDEQTKAVEGLRDEYKTELEKLQKQLDEANAAVATQVKALRAKYEQRANDVLTGDPKSEKEKLDTLAKEYNQKHAETVQAKKSEAEDLIREGQKAAADARDQGGNGNAGIQEAMRNGFEFMRTVREKSDELGKTYAEKLKAIPTGDAKTKLEAELQKIERRGQGRGMGGPGGPGGQGGPGKQGDGKPGGDAKKPEPPPDNF